MIIIYIYDVIYYLYIYIHIYIYTYIYIYILWGFPRMGDPQNIEVSRPKWSNFEVYGGTPIYGTPQISQLSLSIVRWQFWCTSTSRHTQPTTAITAIGIR